MSTILLLIIIGLAAGILSGFIGLGGAIIIIPALVLFMGMSQYMAQGTSLAVMLPPIGLLAAWNYWKAGELNLKYAMIIAAAFLIGGYIGSKYALTVSENTLRKVFAAALFLVAMNMFFKK
ncbi:MAG TPA: sulfite exporter TauE/SafE family protein [Bacteroidales bacterium]|nr:sulfite exporter TauE/SafE family protein [Bacteroidales bacterium]